jgi:DNA-binding response OmpR family regulator
MTVVSQLPLRARVLIVEDDEEHLETIIESFGSDITMDVARTVDQAKSKLRDATDPKAAGLWPDFVLLDIRLEDNANGGYEVLSFIRQDRNLKRLPVLVLTTSGQHHDIQAMYEAGANCFIEKHISLTELRRRIDVLKEFWLTVARLPDPPTGGRR